MTTEQLDKGKDLMGRIDIIESNIKLWERSYEIAIIEIRYKNGSGDSKRNTPNMNYIDFDLMKTLALSKLNKELTQLQTEFNNL